MKKIITFIAGLMFVVTSFAQTEVKTVTSLTGEVWMDRNLGAERVAQSLTDEAAYGWLYQWGRTSDGHQKRGSKLSNTIVKSQLAGTDKWIVGTYKSRYNWQRWDRYNLWQAGKRTAYDPCPKGFRVPTAEEWKEEAATWESNDVDGAFNSVLKIPASGIRDWRGNILFEGEFPIFWTSESRRDGRKMSIYFEIRANTTGAYGYFRGFGQSIRCIKN